MNLKNDGLVLLGAAVGGLVGYFVFKLLMAQGFYGLMLPGGLLGMGAGVFRTPSKTTSVVCGILALALGVVAEWSVLPFKADGSFQYFVLHLYELQFVTLIMIAIGAAVGFWIPFRRGQEQSTNRT